MSEPVHVGCSVLCYVLPNLSSDVVLGTVWLHTINPLIDCNAYSLSIDCRSETVCVLGTKYGCSCAYVMVCTLKLVLKMMHSEEILA